MLRDAVKVEMILKERYPEKEFFILSDSLKNYCCIDLIGARHVSYDIIIHFGDACFSDDCEKLGNYYYCL